MGKTTTTVSPLSQATVGELDDPPCSAFVQTAVRDAAEGGFRHTVEFNIDGQSFRLDYQAEGVDESDWMANQLAIALRKAGVKVHVSALIGEPVKTCEDCGKENDNEFMTVCKPCSLKRRDARISRQNVQEHTPNDE